MKVRRLKFPFSATVLLCLMESLVELPSAKLTKVFSDGEHVTIDVFCTDMAEEHIVEYVTANN